MPKPTPEEFKAAWAEVTGGADTITQEQLMKLGEKFEFKPSEARLAKVKALFEANDGKITVEQLQSLGPPEDDWLLNLKHVSIFIFTTLLFTMIQPQVACNISSCH